jgi:cytochrome c peroxidase
MTQLLTTLTQRRRPALTLLAVAALAGCTHAPGSEPAADAAAAMAARAQAQALFGTVNPVQPGEANSPEAVLGRALFWDARVSLDGKTACASCHAATDWSSDRRRLSINAKGQPTTLHSQPVFMSMDQFALRWHGDRRDGAHQAERSITGSMGFAKADDVVPVLKQLAYDDAFRAAFPGSADPVTSANYAKALQTYQRTLRTPAPFDAFLKGDNQALSQRQLAGLQKFVANGCVACHGGALLGGNAFQKFGIVQDYWKATGSTTIDAGRFTATKNEADRYVYRVPMLRNIDKTGPYFHDGSVDKLDDAVRIMASVQLGRQLPDEDVGDIVAFLRSLTGAIPQHYAAPVAAAAK